VPLKTGKTGGVFADTALVLSTAAPLDAVGIVDVSLNPPTNVFEEGGSMYFDFTNMIAGPGKAELILKYTSL